MARAVFGTLAFFAVVAVISGCAVTSVSKHSGKSSRSTSRRSASRNGPREVDPPILAIEAGLGLLLRPLNTKVAQKDTEAEEVFRRIDTNKNGMVDAAEWVDFSKETSVWDFVELLDYADIDDDEAVSMKEFLSVQIIKIDQSDEADNDDIGIRL